MKKTILIYDDDDDMLIMQRHILQNQYDIQTKTSCINVLADISEINPAIILMDLRIPMTGGEAAVALIKNNAASSHLPVILVSANTNINQISKSTNANAFVAKPFDIAALRMIIEKHIL